jgi:membrane-associated phospholipid phosphatase
VGKARQPVRPSALLVGALLSLTAFLALAAPAAQQHWFEAERVARAQVGLVRGPALGDAMVAVSALGQASGLVPLIALVSLLLWRGRRGWALTLPLVMAGTGVLQYAAKWAVDRPRPNLAPWGFPSGHVLSMVVFFGLLVYVLHAVRARRAWRWFSLTGGAGVVLAVAYSRLHLEMHWLSDVVGGFALGLSYLLFAVWLVEGQRRRRHAKTAEAVEAAAPLAAEPAPLGRLAGA